MGTKIALEKKANMAESAASNTNTSIPILGLLPMNTEALFRKVSSWVNTVFEVRIIIIDTNKTTKANSLNFFFELIFFNVIIFISLRV